jgi:hypothetical protein
MLLTVQHLVHWWLASDLKNFLVTITHHAVATAHD